MRLTSWTRAIYILVYWLYMLRAVIDKENVSFPRIFSFCWKPRQDKQQKGNTSYLNKSEKVQREQKNSDACAEYLFWKQKNGWKSAKLWRNILRCILYTQSVRCCDETATRTSHSIYGVEKGYRKNQGRTLAEGVRLVCAKPRESIKQSTPSLQRVILMEMQWLLLLHQPACMQWTAMYRADILDTYAACKL